MAQSLARNQECFVVPEVTYGTQEPARPVATDQIPIIGLSTPTGQQLLTPKDKTGTRTRRQPIAGGDIEGSVELEASLIPSGTAGTNPDLHDLLKNVAGAVTTISTTINDPAATTTVFIVTSATGITADKTILGIGGEMRPVTNVAGSSITVSPGFTSAPANGTAVKSINYQMADPVDNGLDIYNYDGANVNLSRVALGVVFNRAQFFFDEREKILTVALSGLAADVKETGVPTKPTGTVVGTPIASSFGKAYIGTTSHTIFRASAVLDNSDRRRQIGIGSQVTTGISRGERQITLDLQVYLDETTKDYYTDAKNRTAKKAFFQIGNTTGKMWAFYFPNLILNVPEPDLSEEDIILPFSGSFAFGTGNNEFVFAHS